MINVVDNKAKNPPSLEELKASIPVRYFKLSNDDAEPYEPYAVLRVHGPVIEQWQEDGWLRAQWQFDYIYGSERGAHEISEEEALELVNEPGLVQYDEADIEQLNMSVSRDRIKPGSGEE